MKKKKIKLTDVQKEFNRMIVRRDKFCRVRDNIYHCKGNLQCSHFFTVGANSSLRFYPYNAFTQCAGHHLAHHHRDPLFYARYMQDNWASELEFMEPARKVVVHYSQENLAEIIKLCKQDEWFALGEYIKNLIKDGTQ